MEIKHIPVSEEVHKELAMLKAELSNKSFNETIKYLLYELNKQKEEN